jgi:DNA-binding XRE family transcriptional regulator
MTITSIHSTSAQVTYSRSRIPKVSLVTTVVFACLVGTGGEASPDFLAQRAERGYGFAGFNTPRQGLRVAPVPSFAQQLMFIRGAMPTSVSNLASVFGVSRQTIYDWQNGAIASEISRSKLQDLIEAAKVFSDAGIAVSGHLLKRPIDGKKSLFEICREGGSAVDAAERLLNQVEKEQKQQQILSARLAGRISNADISDFGAPSLSERG